MFALLACPGHARSVCFASGYSRCDCSIQGVELQSGPEVVGSCARNGRFVVLTTSRQGTKLRFRYVQALERGNHATHSHRSH